MVRRWLTGPSLLAVGVSVVLSAQTPQERPVFRSGVDLIEVDVSVVDGDSDPITDLQASDFSVSVDGDPRRVVQAQFVLLRAPESDSRSTEPSTGDGFYTSNVDTARGRLIVIAVDEESILLGEGRHVMRAAGAFVDSLSPADRVALVAVPQPGVYIDFTSDHEYVSRAVAGLSGLGSRLVGRLNISLFEAYQITEHADFRTQARVNNRVCGGAANQLFNAGADILVESNRIGCEQQVVTESRDIVMESRRQTNDMRQGLEEILEALRDVEGPKALLWISGGHVIDGAGLILRTIEDLAVEARTTLYVMMVDDPLTGDITQASSSPTGSQESSHERGRSPLERGDDAGDRLARPLQPGPALRPTGTGAVGLLSPRCGVRVPQTGTRNAARSRSRFSGKARGYARGVRSVSLRRKQIKAWMQSSPGCCGRPCRRMSYRCGSRATRIRTPRARDVRVLVAAEVDVPVGLSPPLTLGFLLRDQEGTTVLSGKGQITPTLAETSNGQVLETSFPFAVAQGTYSLRLAVVDDAGQSGSVDHIVRAWQQSDGSLAVGDLVVGDDASLPPGRTRPQVEAVVSSGWLRVYTELYADSPSILEQARVEVDVVQVADGESGYTRALGATALNGPNKASRRVVSTNLALVDLPPGRYVARAYVTRDSEAVAQLYRPFRITEAPPAEPEPQP